MFQHYEHKLEEMDVEVHRHEQEHERLIADLEKLEKQTEVAVQASAAILCICVSSMSNIVGLCCAFLTSGRSRCNNTELGSEMRHILRTCLISSRLARLNGFRLRTMNLYAHIIEGY